MSAIEDINEHGGSQEDMDYYSEGLQSVKLDTLWRILLQTVLRTLTI